ncbi:MAG: divergent polysaccharide deacetylase family protein [Granulosicoccaceae bacterium]|jgi:hypothetical protein
MRLLLGLILCWCVALPTMAATPVISIIIDDLGDRGKQDEAAVRLPGALNYAFLPHAPHTPRLARLAHSMHKEVILHMPMQAQQQGKKLGPGALTLNMTEEEFVRTLELALASVPHVKGLNNHMGSLLTRHPGHMLWLMQTMNRHHDLFFVDSRTTRYSVARTLAEEQHVPNLARDIFLDAQRSEAFVEKQFDELLRVARMNGGALAIGHPYPETLRVLKHRLNELEQENVRLVPVSELLKRKGKRTWQLSLSR